MTKVNTGHDLQARMMGGDINGITGTATGSAATTLTNTGAAFVTAGTGANQGLTGHIVVAHSNGSYGVILSNTATVLTVDMWHTASAPETVAATPTATTGYTILPGQGPVRWMALSDSVSSPAVTDVLLAGEIFGASMTGLSRQLATYGHTAGVASYTLTKTYTMGASDGASRTVTGIGVLAHAVTVAPTAGTSGTMAFRTAFGTSAGMVLSDQLTPTQTVAL